MSFTTLIFKCTVEDGVKGCREMCFVLKIDSAEGLRHHSPLGDLQPTQTTTTNGSSENALVLKLRGEP